MKLNKYTLAIEIDDASQEVPQEIKTEELVDEHCDSIFNQTALGNDMLELDTTTQNEHSETKN